ncbi:hypothetical protein F3Y22_tig00110933pilonHSYRG00051 [Hibiscus syriacus]|uniref:Leucine-rich repeat-containing N-terminal plant-type domain-containing protein n=1 Tax=Hibiscus syriacus TaxID=106335 RepID=A0A6A2ZDF7_HIBSY|nr:hypothetical protein F3Y22_tig00110933pilonHSYRG00051 [Hibiscus syriacus]
MLKKMKMKKLSTFVLFLVVLLAVASFEVRSLILIPSINDDVLGLMVFKADIQDPTQKLSSWNEDDDTPCNWNGVKCNPRLNRVTELTLDGLSLSGRIGRGLLRLEFLSKLSLAKNNLTNNMFSGKIPGSLGSCATLAAIDLSQNRFSGSMPVGIWGLSGLRSLDLSGNMLEGEIPRGVRALNNLRSINLSKTSSMGRFLMRWEFLLLRSIDFSSNSFSGSVPQTNAEAQLCRYMNLSGNSFVGEVPEWIGEMECLETLDFSMNKFLVSNNSMNGDLPRWNFNSENKTGANVDNASSTSLGASPQRIQVLDLSLNSVGIPTEIGGAYSLKDLRLMPISQGKNSYIDSELHFAKDFDHLTKQAEWLNTCRNWKIEQLENADMSFNSLTGTCRSSWPIFTSLSFNISTTIYKELPAVLPKPIVLNPNTTADSISAAFIVVGVIAITVLNLRVKSSTSRSAAPLTFLPGTSLVVRLPQMPTLGNLSCSLASPTLAQEHMLCSTRTVRLGREVKKLGKKSPHLVTLEGYYWTPSLQLLISEFVSGGSLHKHLHEDRAEITFLGTTDSVILVEREDYREMRCVWIGFLVMEVVTGRGLLSTWKATWWCSVTWSEGIGRRQVKNVTEGFKGNSRGGSSPGDETWLDLHVTSTIEPTGYGEFGLPDSSSPGSICGNSLDNVPAC